MRGAECFWLSGWWWWGLWGQLQELGRGEGRQFILSLLTLLGDYKGLQISVYLSESFGHMSPAAVPGTRMTDFVSLWLMRWNSQILGPQMIFALCTLFLEAGYRSRRGFPKSHFKFMVGKLSFHVPHSQQQRSWSQSLGFVLTWGQCELWSKLPSTVRVESPVLV